ncbi:hypothetical protein CHS0354_011462 [Potamilus streckersoni]|uniref:mRNA decay factor PAT1 domain-containing protein n=1 Tax=Potamilus streckersoni TaxID=2493646 RepID=A0AAE0SL07_9BIVA|nr:hypothetical protein CHS0354_011462 [Potamilus streckersoni]
MEDTCIEKTNDFPALGAGNVNVYENELIEAPEEEEEFDLMNDETFGDIAEDVEFDWEEEHEKLAVDLEKQHPINFSGNITNDSGFHTTEKNYASQEEYMEQSLSRLVVDDEDVEEPVGLNAKKARSIPRKMQSLDELFGPASPPSFLDTERLVSPTAKNIWSFTGVDESSSAPRQPINNLQSLFAFAKATSLDSPLGFRQSSSQSPLPLPKALTVDEIESKVLNQQPKVMMAEELERKLRGEDVPDSISSSIANSHLAARSYPLRSPAQQLFSPVGHLGHTSLHGLIGSSAQPSMQRMPPSSSAPMVNGRISPLVGIISGSTPPTRTVHRHSPLLSANRGTPGRGFSQPIGIPRALSKGSLPFSPYSSPQGPRIPHSGPFTDPGHYRNPDIRHYSQLNMSSNNRYYRSPNQRSPYHYSSQNYKDQYNLRNQHYQISIKDRSEINERGDAGKVVDEYAGIMTQKEREWIIKIQLLQLQTDNPYLDDYYYTTFTIKKKARENREKGVTEEMEPKLVIPAMARLESKAYKPAHFEGSLGRLTTSSVHNPRQIIDILAKSVSQSLDNSETETKPVSRELRKSKSLLLDIERGYNLLLDVDDIEKKILALPEESRMPLFEDRSQKISQLFLYLICDGNPENFLQIISVRKGRYLLARSLPLLEKVQGECLVSMMCRNLQHLIKKDQPEEGMEIMYDSVAEVIKNVELSVLVKFSEDLLEASSQSQTKPIAVAIQNKFGSSVVCSMLHRGETLYQKTSPVDMDNQLDSSWSHFVHEFAGILAVVPDESLVPPICTFIDISNHLEQHLNKRLLAVVEDKLKIFTKSQDKKTL